MRHKQMQMKWRRSHLNSNFFSKSLRHDVRPARIQCIVIILKGA